MATRSTISIELDDGVIKQVYCHWDGYLAHNGKILLEHYADPIVAEELISLGSISSLRETAGEQHSFDERYDATDARSKWTTFYGRDRGEEDTGYHMFKNIDDYVANHQYEEYEYILRNDGLWYVAAGNEVYVLLTDAIAEELRISHLEEEDA
jgi:hypothetical protein